MKKTKYLNTITIFIAMSAFLLCSCISQEAQTPYKTYTVHDITFKYNSDFSITDETEDRFRLCYLSQDSYQTILYTAVNAMPERESYELEAWVNELTADYMSTNESQTSLESSAFTTVNGVEAIKIVIRLESNASDLALINQITAFAYNGNIYSITYATKEESFHLFEEEADKLLASITFI